MTHGHDLVLCRVRAHGRARDSILSRLWLDRALDGALDGLHGVEPEATLLVRHVRHLRAPPVRGAGSGSLRLTRWRGALRDEIAGIAHDAARPARGLVPASASAVLFADEAELLACLASDWLEGVVADRWWWRALHDGDDLTRVVASAWCARPRHVPGALAMLASRRVHLTFAERIGRGNVHLLIRELAGGWGIPWLAQAAARLAADAAGGMMMPSERGGQRGGPGAAPWRAIAPEVPASSLDLQAQLLLGIGLTLSRAPAICLAGSMATHVGRWLDRFERLERADRDNATLERAVRGEGEVVTAAARRYPHELDPWPSARLAETPPRHRPAPDASPTRLGPTAHASVTNIELDPSVEQARDGREPATGGQGLLEALDRQGASRPAKGDERERSDADPTPGTADARFDATTRTTWPSRSVDALRQASASIREPHELDVPPYDEDRSPSQDASERWTASRRTIVTELGGIFYLLLISLHLGHYGDLTSGEPGLALSPWDWLTLVAGHLTPRAPRRDPVWPLLAELAGRSPANPPGRGFRAPRTWRVPPEWLAALPPDRRPWSWNPADERLVVRHPLGFSVIDLPARGDREWQLERELRRYRPRRIVPVTPSGDAGARGGPLSWQLPPGLVRWRRWTGEYVEARLRAALEAKRRTDVGTLVLRHRARIEVSAERVDVWLSLEELPVAVRAAGLDLDPGWIPATGRSTAFHYD